MNVLSRELMIELAATFRQLQADAEIAFTIITGARRAFCAGPDLKQLGEKSLDAFECLVKMILKRQYSILTGPLSVPSMASLRPVDLSCRCRDDCNAYRCESCQEAAFSAIRCQPNRLGNGTWSTLWSNPKHSSHHVNRWPVIWPAPTRCFVLENGRFEGLRSRDELPE